MEAIEDLDPEHLCTDYWAGKSDRAAAAAGLPVAPRSYRPTTEAARPAAQARRRGGKRRWEPTPPCNTSILILSLPMSLGRLLKRFTLLVE
jgi:hypothetical protein